MLKVLVVGVGGIANTHMPGWAESPYAEVVAGCDLNEAVLKSWGETHGIKKLYTDLGQALADEDIDVVDIATPTNHHVKPVMMSLAAGKHVLCEKPLAPKPEEIKTLIEARNKSGKMLMVGMNQRYAGSAVAIKKEVEAGRLGEIYHSRAWWLRRTELPAFPSFVHKAQSAGGPCIDIGVHILDLACWMMDHPKPVTVSGVAGLKVANMPGAFSDWEGDVPSTIDVEDYAAGFVRFEDGRTLILETSWLMHHPTNEFKLWLYGNEGGAVYPDSMLYTSDNTLKQRYDTKLTVAEDPEIEGGGNAQKCIEFAKALAEEAPCPIPAEEALYVMQILDGLYQSHETKREVVIQQA